MPQKIEMFEYCSECQGLGYIIECPEEPNCDNNCNECRTKCEKCNGTGLTELNLKLWKEE